MGLRSRVEIFAYITYLLTSIVDNVKQTQKGTEYYIESRRHPLFACNCHPPLATAVASTFPCTFPWEDKASLRRHITLL